MRTATKKISSLLFILLGFTPLLFVLIVSLQKKEIRHRMKEELGKKQLQTIVIPENEVTWMDKHEIWVNNSMFDIQTRKLENGVYTFTGLYDEEETRLVEKERNAAGKPSEQDQLLARLLKSLPVFCCELEEEFLLLPNNVNYRCFILAHPANPFREILTPPPQG